MSLSDRGSSGAALRATWLGRCQKNVFFVVVFPECRKDGEIGQEEKVKIPTLSSKNGRTRVGHPDSRVRIRLAILPAHLAHAIQDYGAVAVHALGTPPKRGRKDCCQPRCVFAVDVAGWDSIVITARRFGAVDAGPPFDHVEIELENAALAEDNFGHRYECELGTFAKDGAVRSEEQVFYKLLRDGGGAAGAAALQIVFGGDFDLLPVESMVLIEALIFGGDHRMLQIGRDLAERDEFVARVIGSGVTPGLKLALDLYRGRWWVDPAAEQKGERCEQPNSHRDDGEPLNEDAQKLLVK